MVTIVTLSFPYGHAPLSHREVEGHHGSIRAFLSLVKAHAAFHFFFRSLPITLLTILLAGPLDKQPL